ncbi:hypothetical protein GIB67_027681 [Kingdonia uniflora]|uniref:Pentatricopeptide repeat-containing protein n=1 Tax=Kingdonia uniflora TaxID=39325 RepID=A0A7J7NLD9_9MAGN|nr:hypothetical protein GIB67_027681 [Kingdonia uniflora]
MEGKNLMSWNSIILGYLKVGKFEQCLELFQEMQLLGVKPDLVTVSSILGAYFQSGMVDEATSVFRELEERDEVYWTAMIVGYSQSVREGNALVLFNDMMAENLRLDNYTISGFVSVCAKLASLGIGKVVHGHMEKAVNLIKEIPDKPSHFIWSTILNVSKLNSDIERAEMAVNHIPRNAAGPYIMLSNMYASLGRWNYLHPYDL